MKKPFLIAVSGGSGSGKTTIVNKISEACGPDKVLVLSQDHYYKDLSHLSEKERDALNFDEPKAIDEQLLLKHVQMLLEGKSIERPTYDFTTHTRKKETVTIESKPTIILDGIFTLSYEKLRQLVNLKIYIEVGDDLRFIRRLKRDMQERGRSLESVIKQYTESVRPMHIQHIFPNKQHADFVVLWESIHEPSVQMIVSLIQQYHSNS